MYCFFIKGIVHQNMKILIPFTHLLTYILLWNIKVDNLKNAGNKTQFQFLLDLQFMERKMQEK